MALFTPPAFSKAQGKLRSPAPSADFSIMNTAPKDPSRGAGEPRLGLCNILMLRMLSRASSSMLTRSKFPAKCGKRKLKSSKRVILETVQSMLSAAKVLSSARV